MAEKRISELTAKGSSLAANDLIEVSEYVSPGVYRTRYVTGTQVGAISSNFATADLTFTANRTHDISTYTLTFDGTTKVISPGADAGDTAFAIRNNTDTSNMFILNGAGKIGVNTNPLAFARLYLQAGDGNYGIYVDASDEPAVYAYSAGNRGVLASSTNNYGGDFTSTNSYALRMAGANGIQYTTEGSAGRNAILIYEVGGSNRIFNVTNDYRIISDTLKNSTSYADDTAAGVGGVEVGQLYRNGSVVQIRIS